MTVNGPAAELWAEQLAGLGLYLLDQYRAGSLLTPEGSCTYAWATGVADDSVLDVPVLSDGRYLLDGREHAVLIAVDDVTGQAFALDPAGCTVLVVGPVP